MAQSDLKKVKDARARLEKSERAFHLAILAAHRSGETYRDIAERADLSFQRCQEIVKKLVAEGE